MRSPMACCAATMEDRRRSGIQTLHRAAGLLGGSISGSLGLLLVLGLKLLEYQVHILAVSADPLDRFDARVLDLAEPTLSFQPWSRQTSRARLDWKYSMKSARRLASGTQRVKW